MTIQEEFRKSIKEKGLAITLYNEKKILDFFCQTLQRFIREMRVDYKRNVANLPKIDLKSREWNKCVDAQIKNQAK